MAVAQAQLSLDAVNDGAPRAELRDPAVTVAFMLAGNAYVTFQSRRTGTRFTYRVHAAPQRLNGEEPGLYRTRVSEGPSHFVSVLTGPDFYEYLGCIWPGQRKLRDGLMYAYVHGRKSRIAKDAPSAVAFTWVWRTLTGGRMHPELGVWHEGRCGRCGRRLTDPTSIETGLGPVCAVRGMP